MSLLGRAWRGLGDQWSFCSHQNTSIESPGPRRLRLRCLDCQRVTGGWDLDEPRYRLTQAGDPDRHRLVRGQVVVRAIPPVRLAVFPDIDALADYLAGGASQATTLMDEPTGPNRIQ